MLLPKNDKKCRECDSVMNYTNKKFCFHYSCPKCGYESIDWNRDGCCNDPMLRPTKYYKNEEDYYVNKENYSVFNQCLNCGKKVGTALKKLDFTDADFFDGDLEEKGNNERADIKILSNEIENRRKNRNKYNYDQAYDEYLKSKRWKKIREIVLERDNYLCQSCMIEKATEVHHKDGQFRFNEPLFSLVSTCSSCHRIITEIEQTINARETEKIKYKFDK